MGLLRFVMRGVQEVEDPRAGFGPVIKLASSCEHLNKEKHRFAAFNVRTLVNDMGGTRVAPVALGGLKMGRFGIVLMGHAATDMWAVMRNVIWEDEHCLVCCGALLHFNETFDLGVLVRCGPTIETTGVEIRTNMTLNVRSVTDEYWTD